MILLLLLLSYATCLKSELREPREGWFLDHQYGSVDEPAVEDQTADVQANKHRSRLSKFLNLITWVRFDNDECLATTGENGTCYTADECEEFGGKPSGTCASGFGVCCIVQLSCGPGQARTQPTSLMTTTPPGTTPLDSAQTL